MQWPRPLSALWRKAFPVRYVLVIRHGEASIPAGVGDDGEPLEIDDMLPELVDAYTTCKPIFAWLAREHARLERKYHERMPAEPGPRAIWQARLEILNGQIAMVNRALRVPLQANMRIRHLKELAEKRTATAAELAALEEFFSE